jgi:hypothetical protein
MAKKKAELEFDCTRYSELMAEVRQARKECDFPRAVQLAMSAWDHVDGMMQYERRYGGQAEFKSIDSIDFVLRFAPLLFDFEILQKLEVLLKSQRRLDKNTTADLPQSLDKAKAEMWEAHRLWGLLEANVEVRQDQLRATLGGDQNRWRWIAETWQEMGVLQRKPSGESYVITLTTRMDDKVRGKCPACGATGTGAKYRLLDEITCPKCRAQVNFVLLSPSNEENG